MCRLGHRFTNIRMLRLPELDFSSIFQIFSKFWKIRFFVTAGRPSLRWPKVKLKNRLFRPKVELRHVWSKSWNMMILCFLDCFFRVISTFKRKFSKFVFWSRKEAPEHYHADTRDSGSIFRSFWSLIEIDLTVFKTCR